MTRREKREALNAAIALLIVLAADRGPEIQEHVERALKDLQAFETELYSPLIDGPADPEGTGKEIEK